MDIACGTGRFLEYAHYGIDLSEEMVKVAKSKFPNHKLYIGEAAALPFQNVFFDNVLSFHLMMHLEKQQLTQILAEVHRVTKKEGYFIFDIPSEKRRKLTRYVSPSWHGGNQITANHLIDIITKKWKLVNYHGIAFFPIHRIPTSIRKQVMLIDDYVSNTRTKN